MTIRENYEKWLKDFAADEETVRELEAIRDDEKEVEDRFYTELSFGTAGMRGVLGAGMNRMNKYNVRRATKGLAGYLLEHPEEAKRGVVIAYDSRRFSAEFAKDTALVLCQEGVPAFLFDALRPVPVLSYAVRHLHAIAGDGMQMPHRVAQYRHRAQRVKQESRNAFLAEHQRRVLREFRAEAAAVIGNHDAALRFLRMFEQVSRQSLGGPAHVVFVHAVHPGAQYPAHACRSETQFRIEAVLHFLFVVPDRFKLPDGLLVCSKVLQPFFVVFTDRHRLNRLSSSMWVLFL